MISRHMMMHCVVGSHLGTALSKKRAALCSAPGIGAGCIHYSGQLVVCIVQMNSWYIVISQYCRALDTILPPQSHKVRFLRFLKYIRMLVKLKGDNHVPSAKRLASPSRPSRTASSSAFRTPFPPRPDKTCIRNARRYEAYQSQR